MKLELQEYLNNKHSFYKGYYDRGIAFECGSGWFNMLRELSEKIQKLLDRDELTMNVYQVKEKFGTLRFYGAFPSEEIDNLVWEYERKSAEICESCGSPSSVKEYGGWFYNRCENCFIREIK